MLHRGPSCCGKRLPSNSAAPRSALPVFTGAEERDLHPKPRPGGSWLEETLKAGKGDTQQCLRRLPPQGGIRPHTEVPSTAQKHLHRHYLFTATACWGGTVTSPPCELRIRGGGEARTTAQSGALTRHTMETSRKWAAIQTHLGNTSSVCPPQP